MPKTRETETRETEARQQRLLNFAMTKLTDNFLRRLGGNWADSPSGVTCEYLSLTERAVSHNGQVGDKNSVVEKVCVRSERHSRCTSVNIFSEDT